MFMFMPWRLLDQGTSNVFAYLLIIFLGHNWFGFSLNEDALDLLCNEILAQITPLSSK